jgi:hypothetical protein
MPKLYYTPTSCGAASFIVAHSQNMENVDVEVVDLGTHKTSSGKARARREMQLLSASRRVGERCVTPPWPSKPRASLS